MLFLFILLLSSDITICVIMLCMFLRKLYSMITLKKRTIIARAEIKTKTNYSDSTSKSDEKINSKWLKTNKKLCEVPPSITHMSQVQVSKSQSFQLTPTPPASNPSDGGATVATISVLNSVGLLMNTGAENDERVTEYLTDQDMKIIDAMTKYTILNVLTIFVSQIGFIVFLVMGILHCLHDLFGVEWFIFSLDDSSWNIISIMFFPLDAIINCIVLLLNYKFAHPWYLKLCSSIHDCVQVRYANKATKKVRVSFSSSELTNYRTIA